MTDTSKENAQDQMSLDEWLNIRKEEGLKIDPDTAEVRWSYRLVVDPYGVYDDIPEDMQCVGREYFARSPGSKIWVSYDDLPAETVAAMVANGQERRGLEAQEAEFNSFCPFSEALTGLRAWRLPAKTATRSVFVNE